MRACLAALPWSSSWLALPKLLLSSWRCHLGRVFTGSSRRSRVASPPPKRSGLQREQAFSNQRPGLARPLSLCAPPN